MLESVQIGTLFIFIDYLYYVEEFVCQRCGNKDPRYIGLNKNGGKYCRFCIGLKGASARERESKGGSVVLDLKYPLSKEQEIISSQVLENYKNGIDTLINAVCGAGKTELVYKVMAFALSNRRTVGFAVPRRDVVIELYIRIKEAFPSNSVSKVYGGNTSKLESDIIVLTTHQLYRYNNYFDLLILDEIDAFPYNGNDLLNSMFYRSVRGNTVLMSATPSSEIISFYSKENRSILELNTRFHKHPLPVPKCYISPLFLKYFLLIKLLIKFINLNKQVFVFAATIEKCEEIYFLTKIIKGGALVHSKKKDREQIIKDFKGKKYMFLITTAVLERGVTVKDLQVIIFGADHRIYDEAALVQISGRVGRKFDAPEGEVIFLVDKKTDSIEKAINTIQRKNESLQNMQSKYK